MHPWFVSSFKSSVRIKFSLFPKYNSKIRLNTFRKFEILFFLPLPEPNRSQFFLRKFSSMQIPSVGDVSLESILNGMSFLINTIRPLPYWFWSLILILNVTRNLKLAIRKCGFQFSLFDLVGWYVKLISQRTDIEMSYNNSIHVFTAYHFKICKVNVFTNSRCVITRIRTAFCIKSLNNWNYHHVYKITLRKQNCLVYSHIFLLICFSFRLMLSI